MYIHIKEQVSNGVNTYKQFKMSEVKANDNVEVEPLEEKTSYSQEVSKTENEISKYDCATTASVVDGVSIENPVSNKNTKSNREDKTSSAPQNNAVDNEGRFTKLSIAALVFSMLGCISLWVLYLELSIWFKVLERVMVEKRVIHNSYFYRYSSYSNHICIYSRK